MMSSNHSISRRFFDRIQVRFRRARPGSVLILVVALLVLMALIGTAYMSTAQIDRYSAQQNAFNTEIDLLVQGVINMVDGRLVDDLYNATLTASLPAQTRFRGGGTSSTYNAYTGTGSAYNSVSNSSTPPQPWLGDRAPLTPSMQMVPAQNTAPTAIGGGNAPLWAFISAPPTGTSWTFEAPVSFSGGVYQSATQYNTRTNLQPTTIQVASGNTLQLYPALYDGTTTYLAADADGDGIADTRLFRLPVGEINGVTYYAGIRIVDNAAAVNASVAMMWPSPSTVTSPYTSPTPPTTFFPTSVDLPSIAIPNPANGNDEILSLIYGYRLGGVAPTSTTATPGPTNAAVDDSGTARTDFSYADATFNEWYQLGRRLDYPGYGQPSSGSNPVRYQALPPGEGC